MKKFSIDINCDVGEGMGNESQLLPLISSCSIACGGHAGDEESMSMSISLAQKHGVRIGAHPSYPDRKNFGRISIKLSPGDLLQSIRGQLSDFRMILDQKQAELHHIKAHGALYNDMIKDSKLAENFIQAIKPFINGVKLYAPGNSALAMAATRHDIAVSYEAFADRNYNKDLSLVSRSEAGALITSPESVLEHVVRMVHRGEVKTLQGQMVNIKANTYCIHGDTSSALQILMYLAEELPRQRISIER
ncbi:MAG: 5-oxoprolinase subunit PxpA [Flavobacteriaceae bacterium]